MISIEDKLNKVIEKNTFYFFNSSYEEKYEGYINSMNETLLYLKSKIDIEGLRKEIFEQLLYEKENGLRVLLALTGFANESFKRLLTVIRVTNNAEISKLLYKAKWDDSNNAIEITEWSDSRIIKLLKENLYFRKGIINLFFEGASTKFLSGTLPLFELKKLSISKLKFETPAMIDTIVRYKEKGSYSGKKENNPENLISDILKMESITFDKGDLSELVLNESLEKRTMDFIIPNIKNPVIIIESSFLVTTSSGQGDKSKTEGNIKKLIRKYYPKASFVGFVDGIGWYVRKSDLKRMVSAYDDVFTFHRSELERFRSLLKKRLNT